MVDFYIILLEDDEINDLLDDEVYVILVEFGVEMVLMCLYVENVYYGVVNDIVLFEVGIFVGLDLCLVKEL